MFAMLVSYHLNPHDLSPLLLPISLLMHSVWLRPQRPRSLTNWVILSLLVIVFLQCCICGRSKCTPTIGSAFPRFCCF